MFAVLTAPRGISTVKHENIQPASERRGNFVDAVLNDVGDDVKMVRPGDRTR